MTTWPSEVPVLKSGDIGHGAYFLNGRPCCAVGWALDSGFALKHRMRIVVADWRIAYEQCAVSLLGGDYNKVENTNDSITPEQRALLFNATNAALGYTDGNTKAAIALARKAGFDV